MDWKILCNFCFLWSCRHIYVVGHSHSLTLSKKIKLACHTRCSMEVLARKYFSIFIPADRITNKKTSCSWKQLLRINKNLGFTKFCWKFLTDLPYSSSTTKYCSVFRTQLITTKQYLMFQWYLYFNVNFVFITTIKQQIVDFSIKMVNCFSVELWTIILNYIIKQVTSRSDNYKCEQ